MSKKVKYIAAGFVVDAEKLLTEFVRENSPEFSVFTHIWKKHNFAAIFLGRSSRELEQFTQEIFQLTLKFLMTAELLHQIGAVYLLYALFRNQIVEPPTRIRVILKLHQHFFELSRLAVQQKYITLHYVISYLMQHAFDCVGHPSLVGPRNSKHSIEMERKSLQIGCMLEELKVQSLSLYDNNSLREIEELSNSYGELTKDIPFRDNEVAKGFNIKKYLENLPKLVGTDRSESEASSESDREQENIGSRRAQIKSNAFASKAFFRRQLNPTDEDEDEDNERIPRSRVQRNSLFRNAKLSKVSTDNEEDEDSPEIDVKPKRGRKHRISKVKRRIGRPMRGEAKGLKQRRRDSDDISEGNMLKGIKKRGPIARNSCLDDYIEEPFQVQGVKMALLSASSEEDDDEDIDNPDEIIIDKP